MAEVAAVLCRVWLHVLACCVAFSVPELANSGIKRGRPTVGMTAMACPLFPRDWVFSVGRPIPELANSGTGRRQGNAGDDCRNVPGSGV